MDGKWQDCQQALLSVVWHVSKLETHTPLKLMNDCHIELQRYWTLDRRLVWIECKIYVPIYHFKITELPSSPRYIDWPQHLLGGGILHYRFSYNIDYNFLDISLRFRVAVTGEDSEGLIFANLPKFVLASSKVFLNNNIKTWTNYRNFLYSIWWKSDIYWEMLKTKRTMIKY